MILATHAIAGAAIGRLTKNPLIAFALGFMSHFVLDAIPHWQYELKSRISSEDIMAEDMTLNAKFIRDIFFVALDLAIGIFVSLLVFGGWGAFINPPAPIIAGIAGGVLPDALQFVFWKFRHEPLTTLQKFHSWAHAKGSFGYKSKLGIALQVAIAAVIISASLTVVR